MLDQVLQGDARVALAAVVVIGVSFLVEQTWTTRGWLPWFRLGFPLGGELVPLLEAPTGEGGTQDVRWRVVDDGAAAVWWAARDGGLPRGLHGRVRFLVDRHGRVHLDLTWAPWTTPLVALAWLACLGAVRGEAWLTVPLSLVLTWMLLWTSWGAARRAAELLRWSFVRERDPRPSGDGGAD
ncbi:MAG: hypothetical protein H6733_15335 [Alphaproteobacteria bacterium]|nr:hypothetical protein [Alphaproteobacteria bacterium]